MITSASTSGVLGDGKCHIVSIWPNAKLATYFGILTVVVEYFVPLMAIIALYSKIAWTLHKKVSPMTNLEDVAYSVEKDLQSTAMDEANRTHVDIVRTQDKVTDGRIVQGTDKAKTKSLRPTPKKHSLIHARDNVLKTSIWIAAAFIVCWTMNQVYYFLFNLGLSVVMFSHPFYHISVIMVLLQCCFNPIIYCAKLDCFHKGVRHLIVDRLILIKKRSN